MLKRLSDYKKYMYNVTTRKINSYCVLETIFNLIASDSSL